jgi:hypothetical protein
MLPYQVATKEAINIGKVTFLPAKIKSSTVDSIFLFLDTKKPIYKIIRKYIIITIISIKFKVIFNYINVFQNYKSSYF